MAARTEPGTTPRRAFSYLRVSSGQQLQGGGLDRQADMALAWCQQHGCELDATLDLSDRGRSAFRGRHLTHGALGRFLAMAQRGELGDRPVLLIEALDRLSRQEPIDALQQVVFALVGCGCEIVDLEDQRIYNRDSLQGDTLLLLVLKCRASFDYSKRLSRRLSAHWKQARDAMRSGEKVHRGGSGGIHPFWLELTPAGDAWQLNEHAETVQLIFDLLEHDGLAVVAKELNRRGLTSGAGKPWTSDSVRNIAVDPATIGTLQIGAATRRKRIGAYRKWQADRAAALAEGRPFNTKQPPAPPEIEQVANFYPAAVSPEQFDRVARLIEQRRNDPRSRANRGAGCGHSFLAGISTCPMGGSLGATHSQAKGGEPRRYVRCRRRLDGRGCGCGGRGLLLGDIHAHVAARLQRHLIGQALLPGADRTAELAHVVGQLQAAEQQLETAQQAVINAATKLEWAIDNAEPEVLSNVSHSLEQRRSALQQAQQQVAALVDERNRVQRRSNPLDGADVDDVAALLRAVGLGEETQEDRNRLNAVLKAAGLAVVIDTRDTAAPVVGMRFGEAGDLQWAPLAASLSRMVLSMGGSSLQQMGGSARFETDDDNDAGLTAESEAADPGPEWWQE